MLALGGGASAGGEEGFPNCHQFPPAGCKVDPAPTCRSRRTPASMKSDSCDSGENLAKGQTLSFRPFLDLAVGYRFKETADPEKDFGVHGGCDAARLRVLLARVIDGE